ncbi:hypothetical protein, partial [Streptomyces durbertensis]|uniref:hypothetical protein n=1 Tax=Streptomyces durbertensis TaxID=2448886 RepID=UPI001E332B95
DDPSRIEFSLGYATALEHRTAARDAVWDLRYRPGPGRDTVPLHSLLAMSACAFFIRLRHRRALAR